MQITAVNKWIEYQKDKPTPEAFVLIESLKALARTMDAEMKEKGKVSSGVANAYRSTFSQLLALKPTVSEDSEDPLLGPGGG